MNRIIIEIEKKNIPHANVLCLRGRTVLHLLLHKRHAHLRLKTFERQLINNYLDGVEFQCLWVSTLITYFLTVDAIVHKNCFIFIEIRIWLIRI